MKLSFDRREVVLKLGDDVLGKESARLKFFEVEGQVLDAKGLLSQVTGTSRAGLFASVLVELPKRLVRSAWFSRPSGEGTKRRRSIARVSLKPRSHNGFRQNSRTVTSRE